MPELYAAQQALENLRLAIILLALLFAFTVGLYLMEEEDRHDQHED